MNAIKYIIGLSILLLAACGSPENAEIENLEIHASADEDIFVSKAQFENAKMSLGKFAEAEFAEIIQASGEIEAPPQNKAVVSAFMGGYIKSVPLIVGDRVSKGAPLLRIENPEFINMQQLYLETTEQLSYLKSEYERQKTMFEENISSKKNYLKAESEYKTAMARSNSLKKNLELLNIGPASVLKGNIVSEVRIYSPISGYVTQMNITTGSYVSPADVIMEIINTDHLQLELKVFEKDLLQLKEGQEILFRVPEASKDYFKGNLLLIGSSIDSQSRTALVHGKIDPQNEVHFSVGMFVEASIIVSNTTHAGLPEDAVVEQDGLNYVLQLEKENEKGYYLRPVEVEVAENYKGFSRFTKPLDTEQQFLTKGGFVLLQNEEGDLE